MSTFDEANMEEVLYVLRAPGLSVETKLTRLRMFGIDPSIFRDQIERVCIPDPDAPPATLEWDAWVICAEVRRDGVVHGVTLANAPELRDNPVMALHVRHLAEYAAVCRAYPEAVTWQPPAPPA